MAFTNPYDATLPSDTALANTLGNVIREFKGDIAERLEAAGGGPIASRETPEALFGNANTGILFLATDEGITYQWDGTAWGIVKSSRVFRNTAAVAVNNPSSETDGIVISLPSNILQVGSLVEISAFISLISAGMTNSQRIKFGAFIASSVEGGTIGSDLYLRAEVIVTGTNTQKSVGHGVNGTGDFFSSTGFLGHTEDITTSIIVKTTSVGTVGSYTHQFLIVKVTGPNG